MGLKYIYTTQPTEDRVVVIDKEQQRVVEVITTDVMPVQLYYVSSTDQVRSNIQYVKHRTGSPMQSISISEQSKDTIHVGRVKMGSIHMQIPSLMYRETLPKLLMFIFNDRRFHVGVDDLKGSGAPCQNPYSKGYVLTCQILSEINKS